MERGSEDAGLQDRWDSGNAEARRWKEWQQQRMKLWKGEKIGQSVALEGAFLLFLHHFTHLKIANIQDLMHSNYLLCHFGECLCWNPVVNRVGWLCFQVGTFHHKCLVQLGPQIHQKKNLYMQVTFKIYFDWYCLQPTAHPQYSCNNKIYQI